MNAIIITIGDELLIGQVVNTNASFIAEKFQEAGVRVERVLTVGDDLEEILGALEESRDRFDVVVITGGLGPTHDDVTRTAMCRFTGTELVQSEEARENVLRRLKEWNRPWSNAAEDQTLIPRGAKIIRNDHGTAPGELFEIGQRRIIVLPGVPQEMEAMITSSVVPYLAAASAGRAIVHRTLRTTGIPESVIAERLGKLDTLLGRAKLAFLPHHTGVRLRITLEGSDRTAAESEADRIERAIRGKIGPYVYAGRDIELEEALGALLSERGLRIAVAESCTGGLIATRLTNVPGSSAYLDRAVVVYSNRSKTELLGIEEELLNEKGAVSSEVAEAMARNVRTSAGADIGISTTGIAGPSGGTPEKPVGLVWIGYADARGSAAHRHQFAGSRTKVRERASQAALELVRRKILKL